MKFLVLSVLCCLGFGVPALAQLSDEVPPPPCLVSLLLGLQSPKQVLYKIQNG